MTDAPRARMDHALRAAPSSGAEAKFDRVMSEFEEGRLRSAGKVVTSKDQALAIAYAEARRVDPDYGRA